MKEKLIRILTLCLIFTLCLSCGAEAFAANSAKTASDAIEEIRDMISSRKYYEAALACYDASEQYPGSKKDLDKLWSEITDACKGNLPKTGELKRTYNYQGGNEFRFTAKSGNVEVLIEEVGSKHNDHVRAFIRKGDNLTIYVPPGEFKVSFNVGDTWFNNEVGFGDFCDGYHYTNNFKFKYTADNSWITHFYFEDDL